jgi:hypothetical protein
MLSLPRRSTELSRTWCVTSPRFPAHFAWNDIRTYMLMINQVDGCVANSETCELASVGDAAEIIDSFNQALEDLPVLSGSGDNSTILTVKRHMTSELYHAKNYPALADLMRSLIQGDLEGLAVAILGDISSDTDTEASNQEVVEPWHQGNQSDGVSSITCPDWPFRVSDPSELEGLLELQESSSSFSDTVAADYWICHIWPFEAAERYEGPFQDIQTKFPVLFVNPTWDPITPLVSAQNASAAFVDSVVLEHRGNGHCSDSQPSLCTLQAIRDYMIDGALPTDGSTCEPNVPLFGNWTESDEMMKPLLEAANVLDSQIEKSSESEAEAEGSSNSEASSQESSASGLLLPSGILKAGVQQVWVISFIVALLFAM